MKKMRINLSHELIKKVNLLVIFLLLFNSNLLGQINKIEIGKEVISLPINISGFSEIRKMAPNLFDNAKTYFTPKEHKLVAFYLYEDDVEKLFTEKEPLYSKYVMIELFNEFNNFNIGKKEFEDVFKNFNEQINHSISTEDSEWIKHIDSLSNQISFREELQVRIEKLNLIPLGTYKKTDAYFINTFLAKIKIDIENSEIFKLQCECLSVIHVKNKIIYCYIFSDFNSHSDLVYIRNLSETFCKSIVSLNSH
jgi:hypothetical protein